MNLQPLWEKHRKFLAQVCGGMAVFLVLFQYGASLQGEASERRVRISSDNDRLVEQVEKLSLEYSRETSERKTLSQRRDDLLERVSIVANARIEAPERNDDVQFKDRVQRVYAAFEDRANRAGIARPHRKDIQFALDSTLTDQEWKDRYIQLDVLERFLTIAVDRRVHSIEEIRPEVVEVEPVPANDAVALFRYPVQVRYRGSFATLGQITQSLQRDREFIGIELEKVEPVDRASSDLEFTIRVIGVHLDKVRESADKGSRKGWGRGNRGRRL